MLFVRSRERTVRGLLDNQKEFRWTSTSRMAGSYIRDFANVCQDFFWRFCSIRFLIKLIFFVQNCLRLDGALLFWFIEGHAGPIVARRLIAILFAKYLDDNTVC
jgi:hypothetical protein